MSKEIDCQYTDEIICPYCGYEFGDSWEYMRSVESKFEVQCGDHHNCGKEFIVYPVMEITYCSEKLKNETQSHE
jgi:DNA-directed RNA polymerase subunit RPC12/RpoP